MALDPGETARRLRRLRRAGLIHIGGPRRTGAVACAHVRANLKADALAAPLTAHQNPRPLIRHPGRSALRNLAAAGTPPTARPSKPARPAVAPHRRATRATCSSPPPTPPSPRSAPHADRQRRYIRPREGLWIRRERTQTGWCLRFTGPEASGTLMEDIMDMVERMVGR
jgi:hypothetical protein